MTNSENNPNSDSTPNSVPKSKSRRWFKRSSSFQTKPSTSTKDTLVANATPSSSNTSTITSTQPSPSTSQATTMPSSTYAASTYTTTSRTTTLKPLIPGTSPRKSRSSKAWSKTKDLLSSLGEPPTAQYDREQMMKGEVKSDGRETFGTGNYGPYGTGAPFNGRL